MTYYILNNNSEIELFDTDKKDLRIHSFLSLNWQTKKYKRQSVK